jgi:hypothetical protein
MARSCRALLLIASLAVTMMARAEEATSLRIGTEVNFASAYIWRGIPYNNDAQIRPSLTLEYQAMALRIEGFVDTTNVIGREDNFSEVDYTLSYSHDCTERLTVSAGVIYYDYPGVDFAADAEVFLQLQGRGPAQPVLTIYYDFRNVDGFYVNLGVSHEWELSAVHEDLFLMADTSLGWASSNFGQNTLGAKDDVFVALSPGLELEYRASERLHFGWYARYDHLLDSEVRDNTKAYGNNADNFSFGARVSYWF